MMSSERLFWAWPLLLGDPQDLFNGCDPVLHLSCAVFPECVEPLAYGLFLDDIGIGGLKNSGLDCIAHGQDLIDARPALIACAQAFFAPGAPPEKSILAKHLLGQSDLHEGLALGEILLFADRTDLACKPLGDNGVHG